MIVGDLGKIIVAKGYKKLPKVQKIATSGHTACNGHCCSNKRAIDGNQFTKLTLGNFTNKFLSKSRP